MQVKQNQRLNRAKEDKNIFQKSGNFIAQWAAGQRLNFLKKAYQRNDGSYYDESLFGTWGLLIITTSITAAGGVYYHYNIFQTAFGASIFAVGGSLLLFIIAEICLVWFGLNWLRGIYNGIWQKTFADFGIFIGMAIIVVAAGLWDYDINTRAVATINQQINTIEIQEEAFTPPPSIAVYEKKIAAAQQAVQKAQQSTWKGKPTGQGLDVQKSNTDLIAQLEQEKATTLSIAKAEHDSLQQVRQKLVTGTAHQLADYGRFAVCAKILFLLLIPLFEIKNFQVSQLREVEEIEDGKADLDNMKPVETNVEVGFAAIQNRLQQQPVGNPSPTGQNKRGTTVATTSTASTTRNSRSFEDVEVGGRPQPKPDAVEDVESDLLRICTKWGREYPKRWKDRVAAGGKLHTMANNFRKWHSEMENLLKTPHQGITKATMQKVRDCQEAYQKDIAPIIKNLEL